MQKRQLKIDTNFLEEEDSSPKIGHLSNNQEEDRNQAAAKIDKQLSMILCWESLKVYQLPPQRSSRTNKGARRGGKQTNCIQSNKCHSSTQNFTSYKPRSHSQAFINIKTERSVYGQDEEYHMKRNKSTRVINQEVENSRATILKDIVEKLRSAKKVSHSEEDNDDTNEVFKRIAHLERMVRGMRNWSTSRVYKSYVRPNPKNSGSKPHEWSPVDVATTEEDELVKQFMEEIQIIRKQITNIKASNELILKAQIQRSQISENSEFQNIQMKAPQEHKVMLTEGVQTTEKHSTFTSIEEKQKKFVEEGSVFSKATPVTHVNGSQLEASAVDSRESDKYIINQSQKNLGFSQNPVPLQKSSPFMSVVQSNHFPQTTSINNSSSGNGGNGFLFKPANITVPLPPPRPATPVTYSSQSYSYLPTAPNINTGFNGFLPQPFPQPTIFNKPSIYFQQSKLQQIKPTTAVQPVTTFQHRSTIIEKIPSTSSYTGRSYTLSAPFPQQKNPSPLVQEDVRRNITFTNYCSACGRSCGCARTFTENRRY